MASYSSFLSISTTAEKKGLFPVSASRDPDYVQLPTQTGGHQLSELSMPTCLAFCSLYRTKQQGPTWAPSLLALLTHVCPLRCSAQAASSRKPSLTAFPITPKLQTSYVTLSSGSSQFHTLHCVIGCTLNEALGTASGTRYGLFSLHGCFGTINSLHHGTVLMSL